MSEVVSDGSERSEVEFYCELNQPRIIACRDDATEVAQIINMWLGFTEPGMKRLGGHSPLGTSSEVTGCFPLNYILNTDPSTPVRHKGDS